MHKLIRRMVQYFCQFTGGLIDEDTWWEELRLIQKPLGLPTLELGAVYYIPVVFGWKAHLNQPDRVQPWSSCLMTNTVRNECFGRPLRVRNVACCVIRSTKSLNAVQDSREYEVVNLAWRHAKKSFSGPARVGVKRSTNTGATADHQAPYWSRYSGVKQQSSENVTTPKPFNPETRLMSHSLVCRSSSNERSRLFEGPASYDNGVLAATDLALIQPE
jgi:hypothetical protein